MMGAEYIGNQNVVLQKNEMIVAKCAKNDFDYYNISLSLDEIEKELGLTEKGTSMLALKEMAEVKGLKAEGWRLTLDDFKQTISFNIVCS